MEQLLFITKLKVWAFHRLLSYLYKKSHLVGIYPSDKSRYYRWDSSRQALSAEHSAWKPEVDR